MKLLRYAIAAVAWITLAAPGPAGRAVRVEQRAADEAPTLGPANAPVTVELFFTPGQPHMMDPYRQVVDLQRNHPTRVRAIFRPLARNLNTPAIALAAHRRGKFFELMAALVAGPNTPSHAQTIELAVRLGISRAAAERAHLDQDIMATLEGNEHLASRLGKLSNPEILLNGRPLGVRGGADRLEAEYQSAYEDARRAESQGLERDQVLRWGHQRIICGDGEEDDADDHKQPIVSRMVEVEVAPPDGGPGQALFDLPTVKQEDQPPPRFAWRFGRLLFRGTGCRGDLHMPAAVDGEDPAPALADPAPLLAAPLPSAGLPTLGPSDAPVPIFVVCNLRGRFCQDQLQIARRVAEYHPGAVRVVWVPWVESHDGAERDLTLAQAALCAARDGDGWKFVNAVTMAGAPMRSRLDLAAISAAAGLDVDSIVTCAGGEPVQARAAVEAARASGIGVSPTVVIGGRAYVGGFGEDRRAMYRVAAELAPGLLEALVPSRAAR